MIIDDLIHEEDMKRWKASSILNLDWNGKPIDLESALQIIERLDEKIKILYEKNEISSKLLTNCKAMQVQLEKSVKDEKTTFRMGFAAGICVCTIISFIKYFLGF